MTDPTPTQEPAPQKPTPQETAPQETAPQETTPQETTPQESPTTAAPTAPEAAEPEPIALLQIGSATIALPSAVVREVVRWPERLTPSSSPDSLSLGYFPLRDDALPLYDLPRALNLPTASGTGAGSMVVIVDLGAGRVGLSIDAAKGFSTLPADRVAALSRHQDAGAPLYKLFNDPETGAITLYLDRALLTALPGLMIVSESAGAGAGGAQHGAARAKSAAGTGACELLCFEWRDLTLTIDVSHVREIVTAPPFEKLRMMSDLFLGQADIRNEDVAIIDIDSLMRRPKGPETAPPIVLFLEVAGRRFGVPATRVVELLSRAGIERAPFPQDQSRGDVVSASIALSGERRALELDAEAIAGMSAVRQLTEKLNRIVRRSEPSSAAARRAANAGAGETEAGGDVSSRRSGYIKMRAGGPVYADLRNLLQLMELKASDLYLGEAREELAGYLTHRGAVAPVLDLARHLGAPPAFPDRAEAAASDAPIRVALAKSRDGMIGLIVDGFDSIEHLSLNRAKKHLRHQADLEDVSDACRPAVSYLTAQDRSGAKTIKFLDLDQLGGDFVAADGRPKGETNPQKEAT